MGHLNRTTQMEYDAAGRVLESSDPLSQESSFTFNGVGQVLTATLPDETVTNTYGGNGRPATVTDDRGTTTFSYESCNDRLSSVQDPVTGTVSYTYGLAGERASVTFPGSVTWTYAYATENNQPLIVLPESDPGKVMPMLKSITDDQGRVVKYYLDEYGNLVEVRNNYTLDMNGQPVSYLRTRYTFDDPLMGSARERLTQVKNVFHYKDMNGYWQSTLLVQNDYTYDDAGNRLTNALSDGGGPIRTEEYGYDALDRLTSVDYDDGEVQGYTFDPMGNRLSKTVNGTSESYTYNAANMLLTRGAGSYTNDANGNTLTGGGRTNTWDGENRLVQCVFGGTTTTHTYGSDGLRRRTVQGNNTTDFLLDGQSVVRTVVNSTVDRTFLHGPRGPEYERVGNNAPVWYLYDGLGSVLGTVNSNGALAQTRKYDVYGAVRASTGGSGTKHKFVGAFSHPSEDETGLIYMRARWYDPVTGRFASEDPAADGNNWYAYVGNNPTNLVDPSGKVAGYISLGMGSGLAVGLGTFSIGASAQALMGGFGGLALIIALYFAVAAIAGGLDVSLARTRNSREEDDWHHQQKREALEKWREAVEKWIDDGMVGPKPKPKYPQSWRKNDIPPSD
jgi:RHS repeat-associated protein